MDVPVLVAVSGAAEASLVSALGAAPGLVVARRCADLGEVLAAAAAGHGRVALLSADLHRLDRESLGRLAAAGLAVVGVVPAASSRAAGSAAAAEAAARLLALGVARSCAADATSAEVAGALRAALADLASPQPAPGDGRGAGVDGAVPPTGPGGPRTGLDRVPEDDPQTPSPPRRPGRLVAVWGPAGAPGRTTTATALAAELAAAGEEVVLVDADTWGASAAQVLGLLDESAGIAAACRAAATGTLDAARLVDLAPLVLPRLRVLTGLPRAHRWPELGPRALDGVWEQARRVADWVVVDCAAPLETDEEIAFDTAAPRRNGAALSALGAADTVLVVGAADPVGLARLVRALADLADAVPGAERRVVVTKVRAGAVGPSPQRRVREVLDRFAGVEADGLVLVPDDRAACDAALLAGRTLTEAAPSSPARAALRALAEELVDAAATADGRVPVVRGRRSRRSRAGRAAAV